MSRKQAKRARFYARQRWRFGSSSLTLEKLLIAREIIMGNQGVERLSEIARDELYRIARVAMWRRNPFVIRASDFDGELP